MQMQSAWCKFYAGQKDVAHAQGGEIRLNPAPRILAGFRYPKFFLLDSWF